VYGIQYNDIEVRKVDENLIQTMCSELRRGTQIMAVLSQLDKTQYGYSLLQTLEEKKVLIEAGTLYPLLRRLESQGLLKSEWDTSESRPRKYYLLNDEGKAVYQRLKKEWNQIVKEMAMLTGGINL
jgi:PadR family transcriptional regulator PadR